MENNQIKQFINKLSSSDNISYVSIVIGVFAFIGVIVLLVFHFNQKDDFAMSQVQTKLYINKTIESAVKQINEQIPNGQNTGGGGITRGAQGVRGPPGPSGGKNMFQGYLRNIGTMYFMNRTAKTGNSTIVFVNKNQYLTNQYWAMTSEDSPYGEGRILNYFPHALNGSAECLAVEPTTGDVIMEIANPKQKKDTQKWVFSGDNRIMSVGKPGHFLSVKPDVTINTSTITHTISNGRAVKPNQNNPNLIFNQVVLENNKTSSDNQKWAWT